MEFDDKTKVELLERELGRYNNFVDREKFDKHLLNKLDTCILNIPKSLAKHIDYFVNMHYNKLRDEFENKLSKLKTVTIRHKIMNDDLCIENEELYNQLAKANQVLSIRYALLCDKKLKFNLYTEYLDKMVEALDLIYNEEEINKELEELKNYLVKDKSLQELENKEIDKYIDML